MIICYIKTIFSYDSDKNNFSFMNVLFFTQIVITLKWKLCGSFTKLSGYSYDNQDTKVVREWKLQPR